ncbi:mitotic fidelity of chromosome transmission-related protein [Savitreella phatthalungensis]
MAADEEEAPSWSARKTGTRYSEADRRGRTLHRDLTEIGHAGRKTGLRVGATTRDEDGFENMSAFFSPGTTSASRRSTQGLRKSIVDPASASSNRASGSADYADMDESSGSEPTTMLAARRSEAYASASAAKSPARRSLSPTKTHLNSPALRVRSATKSRQSPRTAAHNTAADRVQVARKLDFSRSDPIDPSDDERNNRPAEKRMAESSAPIYDPATAFDDDIDDGAPPLDMAEDSTDSPVPRRAEPRTQTSIPSPDRDTLDVPVPDDTDPSPPPIGGFDDNDDDQLPQAAIEEQLSERDEPSEDDEPREPVAKRGGRKPAPKRKPAARPKARRSFSPSQVSSRQRARSSSRARSPQREWREKVDRRTLENSDGEEEEGVRRSKRMKVAPLAFWRGEKLVYGRGDRRKSAGGTLGLAMPEIKEVIHVDIVEEEPTTQRVRRTNPRQRSRTRRRNGRRHPSASDDDDDDRDDNDYGSDEDAGMDPPARKGDDAQITETFIAEIPEFEDSLGNQVHQTMTIAYPRQAYEPRIVADQGIFFQRTLKDADYFAAGLLDLPPGTKKTKRSSRRNLMFFCVHAGYVEVVISDHLFRLTRGAQFIVPRNNDYEIRNVGKHKARLFFSQVTDTLANYQEDNNLVLVNSDAPDAEPSTRTPIKQS